MALEWVHASEAEIEQVISLTFCVYFGFLCFKEFTLNTTSQNAGFNSTRIRRIFRCKQLPEYLLAKLLESIHELRPVKPIDRPILAFVLSLPPINLIIYVHAIQTAKT